MKIITCKSNQYNGIKIFLIFYIYSILASYSIQLVVLPYIFPHLNAGNGLLLGGDWVGFHNIAKELSQKILIEGWGIWELRPLGHSPAGIAAIFYSFFSQEPYVLIPLNALLHATGGFFLMMIVKTVTNDSRSAFIASIPFIVFPSSMAWVSQIGKDGFYFTGAFMCLFGWTVLARLSTWKKDGKGIVVIGVLIFMIGIGLMGLVRIYAFQLMQGIGFIFFGGISFLFVYRGIKNILPWKDCIFAIILLGLIPIMLGFAPTETRGSSVLKNKIPCSVNDSDPCHVASSNFVDQVGLASKVEGSNKAEGSNKVEGANALGNELKSESIESCNCNKEEPYYYQDFIENKWKRTEWIPRFIETSFLRISVLRQGYLTTPGYKSSGAMIDKEINLESSKEFLIYFPRALQIGFLAPFPTHWFSQANSPGGNIMRLVAGLEMSLIYISLLFLPYGLWRWRFSLEFWLAIIFSVVINLTYSYATPNLGSLYRLRYGFIMLMVAIGVASTWLAVSNILKFFKQKSKFTNPMR